MSDQTKQPNSNNPPPAPQAQPQELELGVGVAQTRNSNSLLRNIVYVLSLMGLISLLFWLITPPNQTILTAQAVTPTPAGGWEIPVPPNTVTPTTTATAETTTLPTETPFTKPTLDSPPTSHITPIATILLPGGGSYGIFDSLIITNATYTPGPPTPTVTPTPIPAVQLVSDEPLLSPELIATMGVGNAKILAWPSEDIVILESGGIVVDADGKETSSVAHWQYSISQQAITPITYTYPKIDPAIIDEFQQFDKRVTLYGRLALSPNSQWIAWNGANTILLKRIGVGNAPIEVIKLEFDGIVGFDRESWSRQSDRFLFVMLNGDSFRYEIQISDLAGKIITTIPLIRDFPPSSIVWSPDGQYLAFEMRDWENSDIRNVYAVKSNGNGLGQLTEHGLVNGNILWSPSGKAIIYSHEGDKKPWIATLTLEGGK